MPPFCCRSQSLVLAILTSFLVAACKPGTGFSKLTPSVSGAKPQTPIQQVVCLFSDARMPFQQAQAQFLNLLDAQDPEHELAMEDAKGDALEQVSQIENLSSNPPAFLLLQPADLNAAIPSLAMLKDAGTRIIVIDPPSPVTQASQFDAVIACDPTEIGRAAAKVVLNALSKRAKDQGGSVPNGRILEIRGADNSPWSSQVHSGFIESLKSYTSITLVHEAPADWTTANVKPRYSEALRIQKSIDVIFAHDDFLAQAAHFAAVAVGTRDNTLVIGINGFAGDEGGLEMMRRGEIDATIQRPFLVDQAWQLIRNPPDSGQAVEVLLKPITITPSYLEDMGRHNFNYSKPSQDN